VRGSVTAAAAALGVAVLLAGAATADNGPDRAAPPEKVLPLLPVRATQPAALVRRHEPNQQAGLAGWVRHEGKWFVWYAPDRGWQGVQSFAGIDLLSGDARLAVSFGFSGWPTPLTFEDVVRYWERVMTSGVVRNIRFDGTGPTTQQGAIYRRVYAWHGYRTDLQQAIRGVLTIHVYRDDANGVYGFDNYTRVGPAANYAAVDPTLARIQSLIFYKPTEPPCLRHDPQCEPNKKKKK